MHLERFDTSQQPLIDAYQLSKEQLQYTGTPDFPIQIAAKNAFIHPILGIEKQQLATFFVLDEQKDVYLYTKNTAAILLRTFSTDYRMQGKGYATNALYLLPDYVKQHFPEKNEIVLAVNEKNFPARKLYEKTGFLYTSTKIITDERNQFVMYLPIL